MLGVMEGTGKSMRSLVSRPVRQIGAEEIEDLRLEITMKVTIHWDEVPKLEFWDYQWTYRKIGFSARPINVSGLLTESLLPIRG